MMRVFIRRTSHPRRPGERRESCVYGGRVSGVFSNTSRSWSNSSRSKQTLLALTPEVKASRKSALVSQRGSSWSLSSVFLTLGAAGGIDVDPVQRDHVGPEHHCLEVEPATGG